MTGIATEHQWTTTVVEGARALGFRCCHFRPARTVHGWVTPLQGDRGLPDIIAAGHGHLFLVELKRHGNRLTPDQAAWIDELVAVGGNVHSGTCWLPDGVDPFLARLAAIRQGART